MPAEVKPKDIKDNEDEAAKMQEALDKARKLREQVLAAFDKRMKKLKSAEEDLAERLGTALDRCKYQQALKKQIDGKKYKPDLEEEMERQAEGFIGVVKREDVPKFKKSLDTFEEALNEIQASLK